MRHLITVLRGDGNLTCYCNSLESAEVFARWLSRQTEYVVQIHEEANGVVTELPSSTFHKGVQID